MRSASSTRHLHCATAHHAGHIRCHNATPPHRFRRISGVTPDLRHAAHQLHFCFQQVGFLTLIFQRVVTRHPVPFRRSSSASVAHRFRPPADSGMFRHPHGTHRQAPCARRTIPSLRLPEGVQRQPGVFPAGRHRAPRGRHNRPVVIAEQIGAQFVWREGISPHEAEFTVPVHRHFTFRRQVADNLHIRFTAPSRLAGGFKHPHLTRGVVLQRQRLTVFGGDAVFCQRIPGMTGARSASFSIRWTWRGE